jgi:hypothetical protein
MANVCPPTLNWDDVSGNVTISPPQGSSARSGSSALITVTISYDMTKKLFLPPAFFGIPIFSPTYTTSASMMIES